MKLLPALAVALTLTMLHAGAALAQATIFESTAPVAVGDSVRSMVQYPNGTTGIGTVRVTGYYPDDVTTYWQGSYLGGQYLYDVYSGFWKPAPVRYEYATLNFQNNTLEGWVRYFGGRLDRNLFIGKDGMVYKRVNITKKQRRGKRSRTRVMYTYFLNLSTFERSDGHFMPFYGMTEADQQYILDLRAQQETALRRYAQATPAFPRWDGQSEPAPAEIVAVPEQPTEAQQQSLAELIEAQVGPFQNVGPEVPAEKR